SLGQLDELEEAGIGRVGQDGDAKAEHLVTTSGRGWEGDRKWTSSPEIGPVAIAGAARGYPTIEASASTVWSRSVCSSVPGRLVQPGRWQVWLSRASRARRSLGGTVRCLRPIVSGDPFCLLMVMVVASQPRRRAVSGLMTGPSTSSQRPCVSVVRAAASTWT